MDERLVRRWFLISVWLKGLDAAIECVAGAALLVVSVDQIASVAHRVTRGELIEDPNDFLAAHLLAWANTFSVSSKQFYAAYLLAHGVVKIVLVVGLLRNQLWAYPASLAVLGAFVVYQLYRLSHAISPGLVALTLFDVVVIGLVWHEYRLVRRNRERAA
jgi:uncharacterized membrane protein